MICNHAYTRPFDGDMRVCMECGTIVRTKKMEHEEPLVMPPVIYDFSEKMWKKVNPWPLMPYSIAVKYGWYISVIGIDDYLVMPILEDGKPVFYSARRLTDNGGPKYRKPKDRNQRIWVSGPYKKFLLIGEGIADAAYLSQLGPAAALLGSHAEIPGVTAITVLDGDEAGIDAAFHIVEGQRAKGFVESKAVILPGGKDPTDIPLRELAKMIREQTGVAIRMAALNKRKDITRWIF